MADQTAAIVTNASQIPGLEITPLFANRVNITVNAVVTRLTFGESVGTLEPNYHTVIVMPTVDAVELARLVLDLFGKVQVTQALAQPTQTARTPDAKQ